MAKKLEREVDIPRAQDLRRMTVPPIFEQDLASFRPPTRISPNAIAKMHTRMAARSLPLCRRTLATLTDAATSTAPAASAIPSQPVFRARLEEHYYNTLLEDLIVLNYDHSSPHASLSHLSGTKEWNRRLPDQPLQHLYSSSVERLPTFPGSDMTTSLLTLENARVRESVPKRKFRKGFFNPIDYTTVLKEKYEAREDAPPPPPYSPLPSRTPMPAKVVLRIWAEAAVSNK